MMRSGGGQAARGKKGGQGKGWMGVGRATLPRKVAIPIRQCHWPSVEAIQEELR